MYHESYPGKAGYLTFKRLHGKICPRLRKSAGLADQATRLGGSPHLSCRHNQINPRTYKEIHTPTMVQGGRGGGGLEPLPVVFDTVKTRNQEPKNQEPVSLKLVIYTPYKQEPI